MFFSRIWPALAASGLIWLSACTASEPIVIGLAGPVSQERGTSMRLAAELAVRQINGRGGVRGRLLELVVKDDGAQAGEAVRVARELYDDRRVVAVIGHLTSGTTLASAPIYGGGNSPLAQISPSASSPEISRAGPYTFRVCPTDLIHGERLAEWARSRLGAQRAAILYQNDEYGRGVRAAFSSSFVGFGGSVVLDDPYVDDFPSFVPFIRSITRQGGVDVLMIAGSRTGAESILAAIDSIGANVQVLGGDGLTGVNAGPAPSEGVFISSAYLPDRASGLNAEFVNTYRSVYDNALPDHRGAGAYDVVNLLARAIEAVGPRRAAIRDYLAGVGTETEAYEGVTGTIAFDANGDVPEKDVLVGIVSNGRLVTAAGQ